ncbi:hypothetical protein PMAYCL1PPCAC_02999, partial [Pristionchus mayeri]
APLLALLLRRCPSVSETARLLGTLHVAWSAHAEVGGTREGRLTVLHGNSCRQCLAGGLTRRLTRGSARERRRRSLLHDVHWRGCSCCSRIRVGKDWAAGVAGDAGSARRTERLQELRRRR